MRAAVDALSNPSLSLAPNCFRIVSGDGALRYRDEVRSICSEFRWYHGLLQFALSLVYGSGLYYFERKNNYET